MDAFARRMEDALVARVGAARYQLWFHRHAAFVPAGRELVVGVASAHFQEWLEQTFGEAVRSAAADALGAPTAVRFVVDPALFPSDDPASGGLTPPGGDASPTNSPSHRGADAPRSPGNSSPPLTLAPRYPLPGYPGVTSNFSREGYVEAVARAVEYVHAGDCFQVNLSQRLLAPLREHPLDLYARLRALNPAPFAGYFDLGDFQLLSASPERFLRCHPDGSVETRPIKGTRPRGRIPEEDAAQLRDLVANPKDRAENVMIVDLLRNDLGRVCEYGSVTVPRVCEPETFRFVHHLVSEVRGKLRPGLGPLDLLAAAFPGGSVTGAPKVRAMEIIAELEPTARGPYCGALGWVGFDGAMDTNILIRTFTAGRGWVQFPVGGGVVADSDPRREYEETLHKAAGLLKALNPESPGAAVPGL
jgi:para-aminobenzoate synthetase component 1